jgi:glutathione peroxidase
MLVAAIGVAAVAMGGCAQSDDQVEREGEAIPATNVDVPTEGADKRSGASAERNNSGAIPATSTSVPTGGESGSRDGGNGDVGAERSIPATDVPLADGGDDGGAATPETYVLGYTVNSIDGRPVDLASYRGDVVLIVNTASRCGFTRQYAGLQSLYESRRDRGLVVLGFPANNFGNQEPGTNKEIAAFCTGEFGVTFPMFAKVSVKGEDRHPLYARLTALTAEPRWNFTKYLVDRDGNVVAHFGPRTEPNDPALLAEIDELLGTG